jgi:hypothetical protein
MHVDAMLDQQLSHFYISFPHASVQGCREENFRRVAHVNRGSDLNTMSNGSEVSCIDRLQKVWYGLLFHGSRSLARRYMYGVRTPEWCVQGC